jgi:hypothetical protein
MHIVYYFINRSVVNGWLLYRRHCLQNGVPEKDQMSLIKFQSMVSNALVLVGKQPKSKWGRPSNTPPPKKRTKSHTTPTPQNDVCYNAVGHIPNFVEKQQCNFYPCSAGCC